ncbi:DUF2777 family protein [Bacillus massilinigeriensis]|uniref:DUF2777 family protein n=1 Tax=Bacillus mediterraneensis TaxID=1805474 RepID=UPI0008F956E2|nr:DUF2777 family protein [Bacillus mediterraneensis]
MNKQQRKKLIDAQERSFQTGTVEYMNKQWVYFEEETEEAFLLEEYLHEEAEIFREGSWVRGRIREDGTIGDLGHYYSLITGEKVKIRKKLIYSLEKLVECLEEETLLYFLNTLNSLHFSIFDSIYCYNHLNFLHKDSTAIGVNFIIFDNGNDICSVHHHFEYRLKQSDRFEFTLCDGKRTIVNKMTS